MYTYIFQRRIVKNTEFTVTALTVTTSKTKQKMKFLLLVSMSK